MRYETESSDRWQGRKAARRTVEDGEGNTAVVQQCASIFQGLCGGCQNPVHIHDEALVVQRCRQGLIEGLGLRLRCSVQSNLKAPGPQAQMRKPQVALTPFLLKDQSSQASSNYSAPDERPACTA